MESDVSPADDIFAEGNNITQDDLTPGNATLREIATNGDTSALVLLAMKVTINIVSFLINSIAITVIIHGKLYRKNMYMIAMIIITVDLLNSVFSMLISIVVSEMGVSAGGTIFCVISALTFPQFTVASLLGQLLYNVDRYLAIQWPYIYLNKITKTRLIVVWSVTTSCMIIARILRTSFSLSLVVYLPVYQICIDTDLGEELYRNRSRYLLEIISVLVGYPAIIFTSYKVSTISRRHLQKMQQQDMISGTRINVKDVSTLAAFQTVYLTTAAFLITGLPRFLLLAIPENRIPAQFYVICLWLVYANGIVNVLIYGYKCREFQSAGKKLFRRLCYGRNTVGVGGVTAGGAGGVGTATSG